MKHIHFIGICGVGMGALAVLWQKKGWQVTGSDVGFYPPVSTHLKKHNVEYYAGWHPEKMGRPDLVVIGNVAGSNNPELKFVLENKIPHLTYPELIEQNLIRENSIVCAGTYAKTSTAALLAKILIDAKFNPAYMFGAVARDLNMSADDLGGDWSVVEGDEYKTGRDKPEAKFFHYHPTHLLLTSAQWDHADVYPTEELYLEAFQKLVASVPKSGLLVTSEKALLAKPGRNDIKTIIYGKSPNCDYQYFDVKSTSGGLSFKIKHQLKIFNLKSSMLGAYMADNICGVFAMANVIGIAPKKIITTVKNWRGIKRRLEKRGVTKTGAVVYDDIAHSPAKAAAVLSTLKKIYSAKIIAIFEPNTGNRQPQSARGYSDAFADASAVVIPRLSRIKSNSESQHWDGAELTKIISATQPAIKYIDDDETLINYLLQNTKKDDCIVFLGSHGFRGMIEELLKN